MCVCVAIKENRTLMYVIPHWGDVGSPFPSPAKKQYHIYSIKQQFCKRDGHLIELKIYFFNFLKLQFGLKCLHPCEMIRSDGFSFEANNFVRGSSTVLTPFFPLPVS